jgi:ligand-binding SRPBCC domain-containing protein
LNVLWLPNEKLSKSNYSLHFLRMGIYKLKTVQLMASTMEEVWDFISSPENLKEITPGYMGFEIISKDLPGKIFPGMIIAYRIKPLLGIGMKWVTEITEVNDGKNFVDEQKNGPYSFWRHQHFIEKADNGVLMTDIVTYKPPFGLLGNIANWLFIGRQLRDIFEYRRQALEKKFGEYRDQGSVISDR